MEDATLTNNKKATILIDMQNNRPMGPAVPFLPAETESQKHKIIEIESDL